MVLYFQFSSRLRHLFGQTHDVFRQTIDPNFQSTPVKFSMVHWKMYGLLKFNMETPRLNLQFMDGPSKKKEASLAIWKAMDFQIPFVSTCSEAGRHQEPTRILGALSRPGGEENVKRLKRFETKKQPYFMEVWGGYLPRKSWNYFFWKIRTLKLTIYFVQFVCCL